MQVRDPVTGGDLDEQATPRPRIELGRNQVPVVRREHPRRRRRIVQGPDAGHQVIDRLGGRPGIAVLPTWWMSSTSHGPSRIRRRRRSSAACNAQPWS
jgi:hypothetical protein